MMKRCLAALAFSALAFAPELARAQDIPAATQSGLLQAGIAISTVSPDLSNKRIEGVSGFVTFDFTTHLGVELAVHQMSIVTPNDIAENSYLIGPRYMRRVHGRYEPYVKVLFGIGKTVAQEKYVITKGTPQVPGSFGVFAFAGGLDVRLSHNITVRAIDFEYQDWPSWKPDGLTPVIASAGVCYRFNSLFQK